MNALYLRISREDLNIENQKHAVLHLISGEVKEYIDVISGSKDDRANWLRLQEDIEAGQVKVVFAYHIDRLGRSSIDLGRFLNLCEKKKVEIRTPGMVIDPSNDMSRAYFQMAAIFAELELRRIKSRTRDGLSRARAEGQVLGRPPILNKEEAKRAAGMFAEGISTNDIVKSFPMKDKLGNPKLVEGKLTYVKRQSLYSSLRYHKLINKSVKELRKK